MRMQLRMQMHAEDTQCIPHLTTWNLQPCFFFRRMARQQSGTRSQLDSNPIWVAAASDPCSLPSSSPREITRKLHSRLAQPPQHADDRQANDIIIAHVPRINTCCPGFLQSAYWATLTPRLACCSIMNRPITGRQRSTSCKRSPAPSGAGGRSIALHWSMSPSR